MITFGIIIDLVIWFACFFRFIVAAHNLDWSQATLFASLLVIDLNVCAILYHMVGIKKYQ